MKTHNAKSLWSEACRHLQESLHPDVFSRWIAVIEAVSFEDDKLVLAVDNDFYQTWLEDNYLQLIQNAVATAAAADVQIEFTVKAGTSMPAKPAKSEQGARRKTIRECFSRKPRSEPTLNPKFTFDTFIIGSSNSFAHAATMAVAQAPARAYNPLFIYGGVGLGKTHLMQAIGHHVLTNARASVCYVSSETFTNEYIDALQNRSLVQFRKKYRNYDLLLIDDIHFLAGKERMQEEFFHTFNALFDAHKQIVLTSDRPASEIMGLEQRLVSRFEWGLVTELESPDLETRIAILRKKQSESATVLSDEVIEFIAQNIRSNIRRLEGAFVRVVSYASLTRQEVTIDTLRYLLRDTLEQETETAVSLESIQRVVADHYDIRLADMSSKRRPRSVAVPRQVAMYLCRRMTSSSLPDIANAFGKTHATVLHAYKTIDSRMDVDKSLRSNVLQLANKLGKNIGL